MLLRRLPVLLLTFAFVCFEPQDAFRQARAAQPAKHALKKGQIGQVRAIKRGLTVRVPKKKPSKGKVHQAIFTKYGLSTGSAQLASLGFSDGSVLHMNQRTDVVLQSPSVTQVKSGEVDQLVRPGSNHTIQTAVATADAVGTNADTACRPGVCVFTVVEGAELVTSTTGDSVLITSRQQTTVNQGQAPSAPITVDATGVTAWTAGLPAADSTLGVNVALAANGGRIINISGTRASTAGTWSAAHLNDGDPRSGWQSEQGATSDQSITIGFVGDGVFPIEGVVIDPAASGGQDSGNDLKDFEVKTSADAVSYSTALTASAQQAASLQTFLFPSPVNACRVQLNLRTNYGGSSGIAASEIEVIAAIPDGDVPATPAAVCKAPPTATPTKVPVVATATPTATPLIKHTEQFSDLQVTLQANGSGAPRTYTIGGTRCGAGAADATPWTVTYVYSVSTFQTSPYTQQLALPPNTPVAMTLGGATNQLPNPQGTQIHLEYEPSGTASMHAIGDAQSPYTPAHQDNAVPITVGAAC